MSVLVESKPPALAVSRPHPRRLADLAIVAFPALIALGLCLYDLNSRSLWLDEAASISIASQHGAAFGAALAHDGGNMLGFYGLLHVLISAFGHGSLVARLPSALAAGATIALTSALALRLFNRRVAVIGGLLGAVSLPLVYWGQDARGYMLMIAFLCASFLLLVLALQRPRPGWGLWAGYVAVTTIAVYMGLEAVLALPAQLVVLAWHRDRLRWVLSGLAAAGVLCIPLAVLAVSRGSSQIFWIPSPNAFTTRQVLLTLSSAGLEPQFYSSSGDTLLRLTEVLVVVGVCGVLWQLWMTRARALAWRPLLIAGWLFGPPILSWTISELGHSMFEARYLLMSLPAVSLLLAWLIVGLAEPDGDHITSTLRGLPLIRRATAPPLMGRVLAVLLRVLAVGVLAALFVLRTLQLAPSYGVSTEPWRAVTRHVVATFRPGDCIAFYPLDSRMPFRYYLPAGAPTPRPVLPNMSWKRIVPFVEAYSTLSPAQLAQTGRRCGRVWLVSGHQGHNDGTTLGRVHFKRYQALMAGLGRRYLGTHLMTYGAARIITLQLFSDPVSRARHSPLF
jgi:4-amino-4-deoxy-L-arabinose transferase-like glycosyltransferase